MNEELNIPRLLKEIQVFREKAEGRIMDTSSWSTLHRLKLKSLVDKAFELQIELNEV